MDRTLGAVRPPRIFLPRRLLVQQVEDPAVFDDELASLVWRRAKTTLVNFVIDEEEESRRLSEVIISVGSLSKQITPI